MTDFFWMFYLKMPSVNPDPSDKDSEPFVEIDPTGRYGRYNELLGSGAVKKCTVHLIKKKE